jgi:hypothetical protein
LFANHAKDTESLVIQEIDQNILETKPETKGDTKNEKSRHLNESRKPFIAETSAN